MAEMAVMLIDKVNTEDVYLDCQSYKRGDVVVICPDGWPWGREELANPLFAILKFPGVDPDKLTGFVAPELDVDPRHPSRTLQRRAFRLDLDALPLTAQQRDEMGRSATTAAIGLDDLLHAKQTKPSVEDPHVFGPARNVI